MFMQFIYDACSFKAKELQFEEVIKEQQQVGLQLIQLRLGYG